MTDFNKAVRAWLSECPAIREDRLYYGFLTAGDGNQVFQTVEHTTASEDICGNEIGKYSFAVIDFRALTKMPLSYTAEDLDRAASVEKINDWIRARPATSLPLTAALSTASPCRPRRSSPGRNKMRA